MRYVLVILAFLLFGCDGFDNTPVDLAGACETKALESIAPVDHYRLHYYIASEWSEKDAALIQESMATWAPYVDVKYLGRKQGWTVGDAQESLYIGRCAKISGVPLGISFANSHVIMLLESETGASVVHEAGHMLGLGHNADKQSIMYPFDNRDAKIPGTLDITSIGSARSNLVLRTTYSTKSSGKHWQPHSQPRGSISAPFTANSYVKCFAC